MKVNTPESMLSIKSRRILNLKQYLRIMIWVIKTITQTKYRSVQGNILVLTSTVCTQTMWERDTNLISLGSHLVAQEVTGM